MPSFYQERVVNWKRWYACMARIKGEMLSQGWVAKAKKFHEVQTRRAGRLYLNKQEPTA